jgi:8-oxo-dGTP pyrophosphatase MutT (NUDIX family)
MIPVCLQSMPNQIRVRVLPDPVELPATLRRDIAVHWERLKKEGKTFENGTIFTIRDWHHEPDRLDVTLMRTRYDHYLYTVHHQMTNPWACRVMYACALTETSDGYWVIGEMADHTSSPKRLQLAGGGIDESDVKEDQVDFLHSMFREVEEELGIDLSQMANDVQVQPLYLKTGGERHSATLIYRLGLPMTVEDMRHHYTAFLHRLQKKGIKPEFASLIWLKKEKSEITRFLHHDRRLRVDYLAPLLTKLVESE